MVYLGIDCGSVSLKLAIVDENKNLVKGIYLKNNGVINTLKEGLIQLKEFNGKIKGVGVTGSGREFISHVLGADIIKTEILAHCEATMSYYPNVRTIIDIGGEDSKIIILEDGIWINYAMNSICGAGTGSVIESISRIIGVNIEDVGDLAIQSNENIVFPAKCGVLMQSAVITKKNRGTKKEDILMGVCRAVVNNYLFLAKNINIQEPIVFQGATALNKGLIKAFEEELKMKIIVPENCCLMGAIGMAMLSMKTEKTKFRGFDLINKDFNIKNYVCGDCINKCELTSIQENDKVIAMIGSKCRKVR